MNLLQIASVSAEIKKKLIESDGEITEEIEAQLLNIEDALPEKVDGYRFITDEFKHEAELWKERAEAFLRVSKSLLSYVDKLEEAIKGACKQLGTTELEGNVYKWKVQDSKGRVIIDSPELVPNRFKEIVQETKIKKDMIYDEIKSGNPVPGARIEEVKYVRSYLNRRKT